MTVGEILKEKRLEKNLSLRQVAYKVGFSHTNVSDIEKGVVKKKESIQKVMDALNIEKNFQEYLLNLLLYEQSPDIVAEEVEKLKNRIEKLEKENEKLKEQLEEDEKIIVHNRGNVSNQIVSKSVSNVQFTSETVEDIDLKDLPKEKLEDLKKFIKYLKNS